VLNALEVDSGQKREVVVQRKYRGKMERGGILMRGKAVIKVGFPPSDVTNEKEKKQ